MIFITGAASAGKTSVIRRLKEALPEGKFDIHDIDEADLWGDDYEGWRIKKIEYWLAKSIENRKHGIETILCGIIHPAIVEAAPSFVAAYPIEYILLEASPEVMAERFFKRKEKVATAPGRDLSRACSGAKRD